ncbi:V-type ATP synthase subunit I domain-containing protein [Metamycoplasma gateae]|uniref:Lipoprotein n=1 Tax=Metamycoplasma gateae TaxID=35769 RepID=A0ABZ2AIE3_9BACT|nr:hypothetical protein V2E26_01580 [Metamycoplasma gateae]
MSKKTKRKLLSTLFVLGATTTLFASIIPFLKGCNNTKNITIQKNEEEKEKQDNDKKEEQSIDKKNQEIIDDLIRLNRESDDFFEISKQLSNNNYELEQLLEIENKAKDLFIFSAHVNKKITDNQLNKNHFKDLEFAEGKKVLMPIEVEDKKLNTSLENILNEAKKIAKAIVDNKQKISNDQKEVSKEEIDKLNTVTEIIEYLKLKENEENKRPEDEIDLIRLNRESNEIFRTSKNFENEFVISSIETDKREELNENQKEELSKDFGSILDTSLKRLLDFKNEILSKKEDAKNVNEKINKLGKKEEDYEGVEYEESKNVLMPEIVENKWLSESLNTTVETAKKIVNNAIKFNEQDDYENKTIFSDSQKQEIISKKLLNLVRKSKILKHLCLQLRMKN